MNKQPLWASVSQLQHLGPGVDYLCLLVALESLRSMSAVSPFLLASLL